MSTPCFFQSAAIYTDRRAISLFFLGFAAGLPFLLIFSSLSIWLNEAGVERGTVTRFSWAALAYSCKFIWSPLVDTLPLPLLTRHLGRRRAWLAAAQCVVIAAICLMALINPADGEALSLMALAAVLLGFSAATQDIVIDAYRIEAAAGDSAMQAAMAATYTAGYRCGMIVSGAISNVFYQDLGYSKTEIASAVKVFGVVMTLVGGFLGGMLAQRYALMRMMMLGALLTVGTNLLFILLAWYGDKSLLATVQGLPVLPPLEGVIHAVQTGVSTAFRSHNWLLYGVVGFDNLAAGLASSVFVAFLSSLTSIRFTAVQYAIFSSLMTLLPKTLGGYSGSIVTAVGYPAFFMITSLIGVPVLLLVYWAERRLRP